MFHVFLSDHIKQDADTTATHRKQIIELFKLVLGASLSNICDNTDGCADHYICAT